MPDAGANRLTSALSRRDLLVTALAAGVGLPSAGEGEMQLLLEARGDGWTLVNTLTGDRARLSAECPLFEFGDYALGGPEAGRGQVRQTGPGRWEAEWRITAPRVATVRADLRLEGRLGVLRKVAAIRLGDGSHALLRRVEIDRVDAVAQGFAHRADLQSHPALGRSFFVGVEFPIAAVRASGDTAVLAHTPGATVRPGTWYRSRPAVYGAAPQGGARAAFEWYIASLRPRPRGVHFNYNSWWTSPVPYAEADILEIFEAFGENLARPHGVAPDSFTIDMGWAKNTTLWQIDPELFPHGFRRLAEAASRTGSRLGLWISPSGTYPQALDLAWARGAGYEADTKACLAGTRYRTALAASLVQMAAQYGLGQVKFDGYVPTCDASDHGHEPGVLSAEAIAGGLIAVFGALRRAVPDVWMEPTCFGPASSPWWLMHANSVTGAFGDDAPPGRVPAPAYRESYTSGRDFYNLKGARDIPFPIASQEVLGIIHQTPEPFQNDAVATVLRGNQFISLYIDPKQMTARRWEFLAALMKWTRRNQRVLAETRPMLPASWRRAGGGPGLTEEAPMPREPYGYAHWQGRRGLVCLRNPWVEAVEADLFPAADCGAPASARVWAASVYPERVLVAAGVSASEPLRVRLAPYETRVIELSTAGRPPALPACEPVPAPTARVAARAVRIAFDVPSPRFGRDYTATAPAGTPCLQVALDGEVTVSGPGTPVLLVLVEGPLGADEPQARIAVDGRPLALELADSEAGWRATVLTASECWYWLTAPLPASRCRLAGTIVAPSPGQTVSAWAALRQEAPWTRLGSVDGTALPPPEERWLASARLFGPVRMSEGLPLERGAAPVTRIDGVYLDQVDPVLAEQGWGTLERNQSVWGKPMRVGGRRYLRGVGTHAPSRLVYDLAGGYTRFQAVAGADQATAPTIAMEVRVDGRTAWQSGPLTRESPASRVDVDVRGARRLELLVSDGGNGLAGDHADWADAMLLR